MQEPIDLVVVEEKRKGGGIALAVAVSLILHALLIVWFIRSYRPARTAASVPVARYVELIKQNPQDFVEAPGNPTKTAPLNAPLSDANRGASMPEPTGTNPTRRPGEGNTIYTPPSGSSRSQASSKPSQPSPQFQTSSGSASAQARTAASDDRLIYHESQQQTAASAATPSNAADWNRAIREVSKVASLGSGDGLDFGGAGGEKGTAAQGPISFETQWYDWGDYAQSMVSRIRVNWYANMPSLIRDGIKGAVTIRFTIQHDGRITDVTILESSGAPPYDYAAKKAIELSSPLNPLPKDFPKPYERVTCKFFYNMPVPVD